MKLHLDSIAWFCKTNHRFNLHIMCKRKLPSAYVREIIINIPIMHKDTDLMTRVSYLPGEGKHYQRKRVKTHSREVENIVQV